MLGYYSFDETLIKQSYEAVALMVTDFLELLSFECVQMLVETDAKYGSQQYELNISLSALGQLVCSFCHLEMLHIIFI